MVTRANIDENKLRMELFKHRMTQIELAERSGLCRNTINAICCGRSCTIESVEKIADALGVPASSLFKGRR